MFPVFKRHPWWVFRAKLPVEAFRLIHGLTGAQPGQTVSPQLPVRIMSGNLFYGPKTVFIIIYIGFRV